MINKKFLLLGIVMILSFSGCAYSETNTSDISYTLDRSIDTISIDYSGIVNDLPGNDNNIYQTAEELLGVTSKPTKLVGKYKNESLKEEYEKLATEAYVMWLFENEDKTASQMYKYYFFDNIEDYRAAYDSFCMKNGSPSVKNEKSLFFGNGGSAKLYVQSNPKYEDILLYFQANSIEVIKTWNTDTSSDDFSISEEDITTDETSDTLHISDAISETSYESSFIE